MYPKNAASPPEIAIGAVVQISDGVVQTAGCTVKTKPKGGAWGAGGGTLAFGDGGSATYIPTQAETNYEEFLVEVYKAGCIPASIAVITTSTATAGTVVVTTNNDKAGYALLATGADLILKSSTFIQAIVAAMNEFATYGLTALNTLLVTTGIKAATVPAVILADGAHGGASTVITLQTPIVANTTQVEGVDATNQIRDSVVDDATRIDASALNTLSSHDPGAALVKVADLGTVQTGDSYAIVNGDHGLVSIQDDIDTLLTRIVGTLSAGNHTAQSGDSYAIVNGDHGLVSIQDDIDTLLTRIVGTLDTGTHKPQSGDAYPRVGNVEGAITLLQAMQVILAYTAGKADGGGTATLHFRNQADDKNRLTMTVDADGNRTVVTPSFD